MRYIRYSIVFVLVAVGVGVLVSAVNTAAQSTLGSSAQLMVPAMIAALIEGQQFTKANKRKFYAPEAWRFTGIATAIAVGLNVGLTYLTAPLVPEFGKLAIAPFGLEQFLILLAPYALGYLVFNRLFLGIGSGNQLSLMRSRGEMG